MFFHFLCSFDNQRGIIITAIKDVNKSDWFNFRYNDQPIRRHSLLVKNIVLSKKISRRRSIPIELRGDEAYEYYNPETKEFIFKSKILEGSTSVFEKVCRARANKEIGIRKRKKTLEAKKEKQMAIDEQAALIARQHQINDRVQALIDEYENSLVNE
jgi:hypothetical protein